MVAMVGGVPLVVDGWHRVAALRHIGRGRVEAEVVEASRDEALVLAMMANLRHGLPLKPREKGAAVRRALGAYLAAFQGVHDPVERGALIARMAEALKKMKEGGDWEVYSPDF